MDDKLEERCDGRALEADEMMTQCEEVSKGEEEITLRRNEGRGTKIGKSAKCAGTAGDTGANEE